MRRRFQTLGHGKSKGSTLCSAQANLLPYMSGICSNLVPSEVIQRRRLSVKIQIQGSFQTSNDKGS